MDEGCLDVLLALPNGDCTATGAAAVLAGMALVPSALQRLANLPPPDRVRAMDAILRFADSPFDAARKHVAVFLGESLAHLPLLAAFDSAGGLRCLVASIARSLLIQRTAADTRAEEKASLRLERHLHCFLYPTCHVTTADRALQLNS